MASDRELFSKARPHIENKRNMRLGHQQPSEIAMGQLVEELTMIRVILEEVFFKSKTHEGQTREK